MHMPVSHFQMDLVVARPAKGHKVRAVMCATTRDGNNVMDFFHQSQAPFFKAPLTVRVLCCIAVADALPCPAVLLVHVRAAAVFIVLLPRSFLVLRAI